MIIILLITIISLYMYMSAWYLYAQRIDNNSVADIAWGLGFVLVCVESLVLSNRYTLSACIASACVIIWGNRLSWHIYKRTHNKPEDERYVRLKKTWRPPKALYAFLYVFMFQATLIVIISSPVILITTNLTAPFSFLMIIGFCVWMIGFIVESTADYQLKQFLATHNPSDAIMASGLWRYSRHPNYFGESLMWWGIWCMALPLPYGYLTIISPLTITYLLLYVSGVPLLEKKMMKNVAYQRYATMTSRFIPWTPRSDTKL